MTLFNKKINKNNQLSIEIKGHSDFAKFGKDIVCSAISTLIITNTNILLNLDDNHNYKYEIKDGYFKLLIIKENKINKTIFDNIYEYLKQLSKGYPSNLKEEGI